jgi:hypothetical protein
MKRLIIEPVSEFQHIIVVSADPENNNFSDMASAKTESSWPSKLCDNFRVEI